MKRSVRRSAAVLIGAGALLAIAVPGARAQATDMTTLTPASHDFGPQQVGITSAPKAFTLTQTCVPLCVVPDQFFPNISVTGDFAQTNDCPAMLVPAGPDDPASCTINVTFQPTAAGSRTGELRTGEGMMAGGMTYTGPTAALAGTGLAPPAQPQAAPTPKKKKKCKKRKGKKGKGKKDAAAAKKCPKKGKKRR